MNAQIRSFCEEHAFPPEATASLLADFEALKKTEFFPLFKAFVDQYEADDSGFSYSAGQRAMRMAAEHTGISTFSLELLLFICYAPHCKELYDAAGIDPQIYHDSMMDLKWKLMECHDVYGVWGSFVAGWFPRFFDLSRFALGRLQFEDDPSQHTYSFGENKLNYGDWVVHIHIPSAGPLRTEDCMASLRKAEEFFADRFPDGVAKFACHSWLLWPGLQDILKPDSHILQFADLFDVISSEENKTGSDLWRIFNRPYEGSTEGFPADTTLRRGFLKLVNEGNLGGFGYGYIFMKDGQIINRK